MRKTGDKEPIVFVIERNPDSKSPNEDCGVKNKKKAAESSGAIILTSSAT